MDLVDEDKPGVRPSFTSHLAPPSPLTIHYLPLPLSPASRSIITIARSWIGTPYRHQASRKGVGCDCLGLLRGVWREVLGEEPELPPPYSRRLGGSGRRHAGRRRRAGISSRSTCAEFGGGDVLLFRWRDHCPAKHCAIATSPDTMVHAHDGACVTEVAFRPWWRRHLAYAFRFPGQTL